MVIAVMDGQGGGIGRVLVEKLIAEVPQAEVIAVGANAMATAAMLRAGAGQGATGENAFVVAAARADILMGPLGIVLADSMLGEITARMAAAVGASPAERILIPIQKCKTHIAGQTALSVQRCIDDAVERVKVLMQSQN